MRLIRAVGKRIATEDPEALELLRRLEAEVSDAAVAAGPGGPARPRGRGGGAMTETTCSWCDAPAASTVRMKRFLRYPACALDKAMKERKPLPEGGDA